MGHGANSMTMEEARAKLCAEAKWVCIFFIIFSPCNKQQLWKGKLTAQEGAYFSSLEARAKLCAEAK